MEASAPSARTPHVTCAPASAAGGGASASSGAPGTVVGIGRATAATDGSRARSATSRLPSPVTSTCGSLGVSATAAARSNGAAMRVLLRSRNTMNWSAIVFPSWK
ncbi:hypothetical protein ACWEJ6_27235 [Nonomuraea sp. NPDC004702]